MYKTIQTDSLEIFKHNNYFKTDIGMVSDNAYLSVIATNNCQCNCPYCINSETDRRLNLPLGKAISNIKKLVAKYHVKEAIILGGEPLLYPEINELIRCLKHQCGLKKVRLTTNGIRLRLDPILDRCNKFVVNDLCDTGLDGINISFHNEDFMTWANLASVYAAFKNRGVKVRVNTNIWRGNHDRLYVLYDFLHKLTNGNYCDEVRVSNIIPKDSFSVNPVNMDENELILPDDEYIDIFNGILSRYALDGYAIFENPKTLGFVRYLLIPTEKPIIINWNIGSTVSKQVCENDIEKRQINTFKCLVNGEISLSWNTNNIIKL